MEEKPVAWAYVNDGGECEQIEWGLENFPEDDDSVGLTKLVPFQEHRTVHLIWEINVLEGGQCLRGIIENEDDLPSKLRALRLESASLNRHSKFITESTETNHLFGHNDMKAAILIMSHAYKC